MTATLSGRLVVTVEQRFDRTEDGSVWAVGPFTAKFWNRYLAAFDELLVLARIRKVERPPQGSHIISTARVTFIDLPPYTGASGFVRHVATIRAVARRAVQASDAVILRIPSPIASGVWRHLHAAGHPYAVEVVGDPYDVFARGVFNHPLRPLLRWAMTRAQKKQCAYAAAAAYVTRATLQARYPCLGYSTGIADVQLPDTSAGSPLPLTTHYSSVELGDETFVPPGSRPVRPGPLKLVFVGSLAQLYKGPDVLLKALSLCLTAGARLELVMVGDGRHRSALQRQASLLGLTGSVTFVGSSPGPEAVRQHLDAADVFVLPSRTEGLPRAMIEAMARGLACVGTNVGGIPELLLPEDLVEPGSVSQLAAKLCEFASDPDRRMRSAIRNYSTAQEYVEGKLAIKRVSFYREVRRLTECWVASGESKQQVVTT